MLKIETIGKRDILDYYELSDAQRQTADDAYGGLLDCQQEYYVAIADDEVIALGDIMRPTERIGTRKWHGYHSDSYFSGTLYMLSADGETALVARYYS